MQIFLKKNFLARCLGSGIECLSIGKYPTEQSARRETAAGGIYFQMDGGILLKKEFSS